MPLLQHEQMWALSRDTQTKLLQEAEKVRMLRKAQTPKTPWWSNLARLWQAGQRAPIKANTTPEVG